MFHRHKRLNRVPNLPPYEEVQQQVVKSVYIAVKNAVETEELTLRELLERFSTWVGHKTIETFE